jgi:hypothetical protein
MLLQTSNGQHHSHHGPPFIGSSPYLYNVDLADGSNLKMAYYKSTTNTDIILSVEPLISTVAKPAPAAAGWVTSYRIPETTYAKHYELYLHANMRAGTFSGRVFIHIEVKKRVYYLVVHEKGLGITKDRLYKGIYLSSDFNP